MNLKIRQQQAKRIAATRGLSLLTLAQFSKETGFPVPTISTLETKFASGITERTWRRLVEAFAKVGVDVSIDWLKEGKGPSPVNLKLFDKSYKPSEDIIKQIRAIIN